MLRGFGRKNKAKAIQVVVYRRDKIFKTATHGIGAERFFYSPLAAKGEVTLDDRITHYEQQLDGYIDELRTGSIEKEVDGKRAAEIVVHLTVRTAQLRQSFAAGAEQVAQGVAATFLDPAKRWRMLGYHLPKPTGEVKATIEKAYQESGFRARGIPRKAFFKMMFDGMKENFKKEAQVKELEAAVATLVKQVPEMAASGHRASLAKSLAPDLRVEALRSMIWRVRESSYDFLLPDCVAIEGRDVADARPLAYAPNESANLIFMPITSRRVLLGHRGAMSGDLPAELNTMLARCSYEFFVGQERTREFEELVTEIGQVTESFMKVKVDEGLRGAFKEETGGRP